MLLGEGHTQIKVPSIIVDSLDVGHSLNDSLTRKWCNSGLQELRDSDDERSESRELAPLRFRSGNAADVIRSCMGRSDEKVRYDGAQL